MLCFPVVLSMLFVFVSTERRDFIYVSVCLSTKLAGLIEYKEANDTDNWYRRMALFYIYMVAFQTVK